MVRPCLDYLGISQGYNVNFKHEERNDGYEENSDLTRSNKLLFERRLRGPRSGFRTESSIAGNGSVEQIVRRCPTAR